MHGEHDDFLLCSASKHNREALSPLLNSQYELKRNGDEEYDPSFQRKINCAGEEE
jgi:predicted NUDIX family phosphoesterase